MLIYQICLFIFMMLLVSNCETGDGALLSILIWIVIAFLSFIINKKGKQMTKAQRVANIKKYKYKEIYYNNFGELP